jgi:hypothetical protein
MGIEEDTPGLGFWISLGLGLLAGVLSVAWLGAAWWAGLLVAGLVGGAMLLLLA